MLHNQPIGNNYFVAFYELAYFLLFVNFKEPTAFEISKLSMEEVNAPGMLKSPANATKRVITSAGFPWSRHLHKQHACTIQTELS